MSRLTCRPAMLLNLLVLLTLPIVVGACCCTGALDDEELLIYEPESNPIPPVAVISADPNQGVEPLEVQLDATESYDTDGEIVQYDWDFDGDGTFDSMDGGPTPVHTYASSSASDVSFVETGEFNPVVRVTDNDGLSDEASTAVIIGELAPPVAAVSATPSNGIEPLDVQLDATASYDTDGEIVQYDWDFNGDGTYDLMDGGATPSHTYESGGSSSVSFVETGQFSATVRVTDDDGLTDEASTTVTIGELVPPVAALSATPSNGVEPLDVQLDATESYDTDGEIVQYDWDFDGDGTYDLMDGGATPSYTYASGGSSSVSFVETGQFSATVRVTDDDGLTDEASTTVTIGELLPPTAMLAPDPATGNAPLDVTWDASGSFDDDGTIEQYDWDMDNDSTFEIEDGGDTQATSYPDGGIYTVGVRVHDNDGLTDETTADVDVNDPPVAVLEGNEAPGSDEGLWDITWDAAGSYDDDGTIVRYDWDLDNDSTYETPDGGATQVQTDLGYGSYTVGVMVTDDDGATDETTATVELLSPPFAVLAPEPDTGTAPIDVTWHGDSSYDLDGVIVQYDWDMEDDGTYEIIDGGVSQPVNYPVGGLYSVSLRVTDDDGLTGEASFPIDINNPPTAVLTNTFEFLPNEDMVIHWDATGSFDTDGTIEQYDWDMDNNGTFEITDGGANQDMDYLDPDFQLIPIVGVRVTDDDGAQDETYESAILPPIGIVTPDPAMWGYPPPCDVEWDASASWDPDGGSIVTYHWDTDNDGVIDIWDGGPTQTVHYDEGAPEYVYLRIVVIDDEGQSGEGIGMHYMAQPT